MNKSLLTIILALAVALVLTACRSNTEDPTEAPNEPTAAQTEISETVEVTEVPTEPTLPDELDPDGEVRPEVPTQPAETVEPTQPADSTEQTLPGDVDVSLGVVPGESTPDLDEEDGSSNSGTAQPPQTQPTTGGNSGSEDAPVITEVTYESYIAMSGEQQQAFINQFASVEEFVKWYNASKEKYDAEHPDIEIGGDTVIDGSQLGKS